MMGTNKENEFSLVECFIASFEKLDEMSADEVLDPVAWQLAVGEPDQYGVKAWRPIKVNTPIEALEAIYVKLPGRFPPFYEHLVLSYRWAEVDLHAYRLLANPPGPGLNGLLEEMSRDPVLWTCLLHAGYIRFGMGPDTNYDPVCFDFNSRKKNGDCRIVKVDHEEILCNDRVKVIAELAPTFESLVQCTIETANQRA